MTFFGRSNFLRQSTVRMVQVNLHKKASNFTCRPHVFWSHKLFSGSFACRTSRCLHVVYMGATWGLPKAEVTLLESRRQFFFTDAGNCSWENGQTARTFFESIFFSFQKLRLFGHEKTSLWQQSRCCLLQSDFLGRKTSKNSRPERMTGWDSDGKLL